MDKIIHLCVPVPDNHQHYEFPATMTFGEAKRLAIQHVNQECQLALDPADFTVFHNFTNHYYIAPTIGSPIPAGPAGDYIP